MDSSVGSVNWKKCTVILWYTHTHTHTHTHIYISTYTCFVPPIYIYGTRLFSIFSMIVETNVLFFPTYWILQCLHSNRQIIHLLSQLMLWKMLYLFFVCVLLKKSFLEFYKYGEHIPLMFLFWFYYFLLYSILLLPIIYVNFVFLL